MPKRPVREGRQASKIARLRPLYPAVTTPYTGAPRRMTDGLQIAAFEEYVRILHTKYESPAHCAHPIGVNKIPAAISRRNPALLFPDVVSPIEAIYPKIARGCRAMSSFSSIRFRRSGVAAHGARVKSSAPGMSRAFGSSVRGVRWPTIVAMSVTVGRETRPSLQPSAKTPIRLAKFDRIFLQPKAENGTKARGVIRFPIIHPGWGRESDSEHYLARLYNTSTPFAHLFMDGLLSRIIDSFIGRRKSDQNLNLPSLHTLLIRRCMYRQGRIPCCESFLLQFSKSGKY